MKNINLIIFISLIFTTYACTQTVTERKDMKKINTTDITGKYKKLTPEEEYIIINKGTERPFTGELLNEKRKGTYVCKQCNTPLYRSEDKFDSHCGWPSFDDEIEGAVTRTVDADGRRTEITCTNCGGHLGHVFIGEQLTTKNTRHCVNSLSMNFIPEESPKALNDDSTKSILFGGGCFWCTEAVFDMLNGVVDVESGYSGGVVPNPTYREVTTGNTGHAEVIKVTYKPSIISIDELIEIFYTSHDPTTLNRQGADIGTQYRSAIYYYDNDQKERVNYWIEELNKNTFDNKITTEVKLAETFYPAEDYHQEYYELNGEEPYCRLVILPKVEKVQKLFNDKLKKTTH